MTIEIAPWIRQAYDLKMPLHNRSGERCRVICVDRLSGHQRPIVALCVAPHTSDGQPAEMARYYRPDGRAYDGDAESPLDLVEPK
jgi:hypothetical protein